MPQNDQVAVYEVNLREEGGLMQEHAKGMKGWPILKSFNKVFPHILLRTCHPFPPPM